MMKNILTVLQTVYENLPIILVIIGTIIGIVLRVKRFVRMTKEQKQAMLQEQADKVVEFIKQQLLSIVTKAEKEWGGGTGKIKKSWVWEQLAAQYGSLMQYVEAGLIQKDTIDKLIEDAVGELEHLRNTNDKVAAVIEPTPGRSETP